MKTKMILNWAGMQSVIIHAISNHGGRATWKEIKEAVLAEGWNPSDWLTQVRGPLQGLINDNRIKRVDNRGECEIYVLAP